MTRLGPDMAFGLDEALSAQVDWGMNCGPGALAGVLGLSPEEIRQHLPDFPDKQYTNEIMLEAALEDLGVAATIGRGTLPAYGLARVLWKGPWWDDPDPYARERRSHWIGVSSSDEGRMIFDINAIKAGGWILEQEWRDVLVPWLLEGGEATGGWEVAETYEIDPGLLPPRPDYISGPSSSGFA
ncbi:MAG: hypothetical protein ABJN42_19845 [Roseibium sp.]|uniref:hypothetical protein n=1 Tax=Roseibium sp. TaxID=1936156 RepID=UPI00329A3C76